jgi:hypothetical protein
MLRRFDAWYRITSRRTGLSGCYVLIFVLSNVKSRKNLVRLDVDRVTAYKACLAYRRVDDDNNEPRCVRQPHRLNTVSETRHRVYCAFLTSKLVRLQTLRRVRAMCAPSINGGKTAV